MRPPTTELAALERLRNTPVDLIMGKIVFPLFLCCFWLDPFDTFIEQEQALKLGWVWIFLNEIWPWHIGLRWAIVALWATCLLACPQYLDQRRKYMKRCYWSYPTLNKFDALMTSINKHEFLNLSKYIYFATKLRNDLDSQWTCFQIVFY